MINRTFVTSFVIALFGCTGCLLADERSEAYSSRSAYVLELATYVIQNHRRVPFVENTEQVVRTRQQRVVASALFNEWVLSRHPSTQPGPKLTKLLVSIIEEAFEEEFIKAEWIEDRHFRNAIVYALSHEIEGYADVECERDWRLFIRTFANE